MIRIVDQNGEAVGGLPPWAQLLILIVSVLGSSAVVAWVRSPSIIEKTRAEAHKLTVDTLSESVRHVTQEVSSMRDANHLLEREVSEMRLMYQRCEDHRREQDDQIERLRAEVERLTNLAR